jgi:hypothetical protein
MEGGRVDGHRARLMDGSWGMGGGPWFAVGRRARLMDGGRVDGHRARLMDGPWGMGGRPRSAVGCRAHSMRGGQRCARVSGARARVQGRGDGL